MSLSAAISHSALEQPQGRMCPKAKMEPVRLTSSSGSHQHAGDTQSIGCSPSSRSCPHSWACCPFLVQSWHPPHPGLRSSSSSTLVSLPASLSLVVPSCRPRDPDQPASHLKAYQSHHSPRMGTRMWACAPPPPNKKHWYALWREETSSVQYQRAPPAAGGGRPCRGPV